MAKQNEQRLVPKLRFKGFSEDWEQRKLGQVADIVGGGTPSTKEISYWNGNINWFTPNEIGDDKYIKSSIRKITEEGLRSSSAQLLPANKTILFTSRATIGSVAILEEAASTNQGFQSLIVNENNDINFIYYKLLTMKKLFLRNSVGSTFLEISGKTMRNIDINVPDKNEQEQIGNLLSKLDETITLHKRKKQALIQQKNYFLRQLIPLKSNSPKLRFRGFTADWNKIRFVEFANLHNSQRVPIAANYRVKGMTPYYGANGIQDYVQGYTHDGEFILVAEDGASDLNKYPVNYVNGKIWVNNHAHVISGKNSLAKSRFLTYRFKRFNYVPFLVGGSRSKLNASTLATLKMGIPSTKEQTMIADILLKISYIMELQEKKISNLNKLKDQYLNSLFI